MKRSIKITIGSVIGIVVIAGIALAANGDLLQGRLSKNIRSLPASDEPKVERPERGQKMLPAYDEEKYEEYKNDPMSSYNCKTYTIPGVHTLFPCDSIEYNGSKFKVTYMSPTDIVGSIVYSMSQEYDYQDNKFHISLYHIDRNHAPISTTGNLNMVLEEINYSPGQFTFDPWTYEAKIHLYETCAEVREVCEEMNTSEEEYDKIKCDSICPNQEDNPDKDYYYGENVVVSMPKGYEAALEVAGKNADNCYENIENLFGVETEFPIRITYSEDTSNPPITPMSACSLGEYFGEGVFCQITTIYADSNNIVNDETFQEMQELVNDGGCYSSQFNGAANGVGSILFNHPHEMTHYYAKQFEQINAYLSEGIATYAENELGGKEHPLICDDDAYYYGDFSGPFPYNYEPLTSGSYGIGACFIRDLVDHFGEQKLKQLFSEYKVSNTTYYSTETNTNDESMVGIEGCNYLFADILAPVFGPDVFDTVKDKYELEEDIFVCNFASLKNN